jgi:hypothetical protein
MVYNKTFLMITTEEHTDWARRNLSPQDIQRMLESRFGGVAKVDEYVLEYKKYLASLRQQKGFYMLGLAAVLCLLSMLGTLLDSHVWLNSFFLYGLTPAGAGIGLYGLWLIFEDP